MSGKELKEKILATGVSVTEVGRRIGMNQPSMAQALTAIDIKTGFLEKVAAALNMQISDFYNESIIIKNSVHRPVIKPEGGTNAINVGTGGAHMEDPALVKSLIDEIAALRKQNEKLMDKLLEK